MNMIVDHGGEQVMGCRYRVEIAGEMQVNVFHRHDLRMAAPGRPTFGAETGAQRRFAQRQDCAFADSVERVRKAD